MMLNVCQRVKVMAIKEKGACAKAKLKIPEFSNGLYLSSPKARQEYMEVALEPTSRARNIIGDNPIDLIELIILIPFKPNFEMGSRWYMFVRKEFTPNFFFKPWLRRGEFKAQEENHDGLGQKCAEKRAKSAEACKKAYRSVQQCARACSRKATM